jgi:predicted AlkP superfamily phosphohydrolase/phosphomutase
MKLVLTYVDPGSGFVFAQNASILWGVILASLGGFFFFIKFFFGFLKRIFWIILIATGIVIIGGKIMHKPSITEKVIIVGIDAMDPRITEQLIREGRLPNFARLKQEGTYSPLATVVPPESVVAWTSISTGTGPGSHAIFDFIMRDPATYIPYLSFNDVAIGKGNERMQVRRKGDTFWNILSRNNVPCFLYFFPNTFPPEAINGAMLSGMGVPDLYGMIGRYSFYTSRPLKAEDKESRGKIVHVEAENNVIRTELYGPKIAAGGRQPTAVESTVALHIRCNPGAGNAVLEFQKARIMLAEGAWSGWQRVAFSIGPFRKAYGIVRFYLKSVQPEFELYASPVNFSPENPLFPISYPHDYSRLIAKKDGFYYTQGMPNDTWALTEERLDEKAFLEHVDTILQERETILNERLRSFKGGVFFFYLDTLDAVQHLFWRYLDVRHPLHEDNSPYQDTIFKYYEKIDRIIGEIRNAIGDESTLIVLSDHGFNTFRRSVNLNRWLLENGYLSLKEGVQEGRELLEDVDWSMTKAYSLGFGGIYLNMAGREYYGIVNENEARDLKEEIVKKLAQFRDPKTGETVVNNVYRQEEAWSGPHAGEGPDLFVGFKAGFRSSWQTALGAVPNVIFADNRSKWSGEHLIDAALVPGVLFVNRKIDVRNPSLLDIAPTLLDLFGVSKPAVMQGKSLFNDGNNFKARIR